MIKSLIKIAVAIVVANALWRVSSAYITNYRFSDSVMDLATHAVGKTDSELKEKVVELAATYDEPLDADSITIRQEEHHTFINGAYAKPIMLFPGYELQWPFKLDVDVVVPRKPGDLANPQ